MNVHLRRRAVTPGLRRPIRRRSPVGEICEICGRSPSAALLANELSCQETPQSFQVHRLGQMVVDAGLFGAAAVVRFSVAC